MGLLVVCQASQVRFAACCNKLSTLPFQLRRRRSRKLDRARGVGTLFAVVLIALLASFTAPQLRASGYWGDGVAAALTSPAAGSTLSGSTVTFSWSAGTNVRAYTLHLNTAPGNPQDPNSTRLFSTGTTTATVATVSSVPTTGAVIYAILGSDVNGKWKYTTYAFTEAPSTTMKLGVSATSLSFGSINVNTATTQAVTLSSTGTASVTVSAVAVSGTGFTVSGASLPLTLSPNQTATLKVQFDPTAAGAATGALTLTSNSSTGTSTAVSLSGTGVPALTGLNCTSSSMAGAGTDACKVTLNAAAASGGFPVSVASNNSAVTVPATVTVAAGATAVSFSAAVSSVSTVQTVTLAGNAGGASKTFALQLGATVPTLGVSVTNLAFGSVAVKSTAAQSVTLTSTGSTYVTVNAATVSGTGFTVSGANFPLNLSPNQTATLTVQFGPNAAGAATGTLTMTSNSSTGTSSAVSLSGTGVPTLTGLTCSSGSMTGAGTDTCTVTLNVAAASGGLAVSLASNNSAVTVPATATVAAGATTASFLATVSSVSSGAAVSLTASAGSVKEAFTLQLGATTPTLSINATSMAFGDVNVNSPATQTVTLTSTGTASVTVSAATVTGIGFKVSGASFPLTLSPNQAATLSVQFDPTAAGAASGTLTIVSTSLTCPTDVISLSGTGESASYEVNLTWAAPSSSSVPVTGYNVYRAPSGSTSYQQINTSPVTQTAYTDNTVQAGETYDYTVKSVDASDVASVPSNMASITTP